MERRSSAVRLFRWRNHGIHEIEGSFDKWVLSDPTDLKYTWRATDVEVQYGSTRESEKA